MEQLRRIADEERAQLEKRLLLESGKANQADVKAQSEMDRLNRETAARMEEFKKKAKEQAQQESKKVSSVSAVAWSRPCCCLYFLICELCFVIAALSCLSSLLP